VSITLLRPLPSDSRPSDGPRRGSAQRLAMVTVVLAIVFQPILHPTGPGNSSPVDLFTAAAIAAFALWATGSHQKLRAPYLVPVSMMVAAGAASGLRGALPTVSLAALVTDLLLFAWCVTVVNVLDDPRVLRVALAAWSWSSILWAAVVVVGWLGHITVIEGLQPVDGNRVMFTFGDPNYASAYWDVALFVVYATRTPAVRWMRVTGYVLLGGALALTESNGGVLALGMGIGFLLLARSHRRRGWVGLAAVALAVVVAVAVGATVLPLNTVRQWAADSGQPFLTNSIGRSAQSSSERLVLINEMKQLVEQDDSVLGLGPMAIKPTLSARLYPYANEAHNDYLAALVERGVVGLLGLLVLVGTAAVRAGPLVRGPLAARYAAVVPAPAGLVAGLLVLATNSLYEEVLHYRFLWLLLGVVAVLGRDGRRR
jgi:hypothetical protein